MEINLGSWDFKTQHVQPDQFGSGKNYISAESIVICAAKNDTTGTVSELIPIGVMQNAGFSQQKQINQLYEIGGRLPFFIPGRTLVQLNMTRVVFNGDSLMAVLYSQNEPAEDPETSPGPTVTAGTDTKKFYMNLASELFNKGIDIALVIQDSEGEPGGGIIFRECIIQSHGMGISSNQTVVAENISLRAKSLEALDISVTSGD